MSILAHPADTTPTPGEDDSQRVVNRLQKTLDRVMRHREALLAENRELAKRAVHWFVDDGEGYCQACNTKRDNLRHITSRRVGGDAA